jgi:hypothetical protein
VPRFDVSLSHLSQNDGSFWESLDEFSCFVVPAQMGGDGVIERVSYAKDTYR